MTDRDDYPDNPYRGRTNSRGDGYDPLSDPLPAQPPPRGRRARPEPGSEDPASGRFRHTGPATGEFRMYPSARSPGGEYYPTNQGAGDYYPSNQGGPPQGRRRRAEPPPSEGPRRSGGAADALRGGRAARSGTARPQHPEPGNPGADPTQDALAALANLGGHSGQDRPPGSAEPPHGGRSTHHEEDAAARSPLWAERDEESTSPFFAGGSEDGPRGRRARGGRGTGEFQEAGAEEPRSARRRHAERTQNEERMDGGSTDSGSFPQAEGREERRGRRRRARREDGNASEGGFFADAPAETDVFDTGGFPGVDQTADTGGFSRVDDTAGRRRRRRAHPSHDTGAFAAGGPDHGADTGGFHEVGVDPEGSRAVDHDADEERQRVAGAFPDGAEEEPTGRRGRRKLARRAARQQSRHQEEEEEGAQESAPEDSEAEEDEGHEELQLADIADAYGGGRRSRKKLKEAKRKASGKPRRRRRKGPMIALCLTLVLVVAGGGFGVVRTYVFPPDHAGDGEGEVTFVIEEGESGATVADNLADAGVVASGRAFTNALHALPDEDLGDGLLPGTYTLAEGMSGESAVNALLDSDNRLGGRVTIREGLRAEQILEAVADSTGLSLEELQEAYADDPELNLPEYATEGAEGYLFPATYRFEPDAEAPAVLRTMVTQYRQVSDEMDLEDRADELGMDPNEVMAIAAIVQAESGDVDDMPLVSRVVYNRLDEDMPLQMDSTCFYAIDEYGIALTDEQRAACDEDDSGFDTYHETGLVPGPFVAPGEDAIEAALAPAEGDWLYFVATDPESGITEFTEDYDEFLELREEFRENWGEGE